jgi:hypothetical protein
MAGKSGWVAITDSLGISRLVLPVPCGIRGMMNAGGKRKENENHLILLARPLLMSDCLSVYCEGYARAIGKMVETTTTGERNVGFLFFVFKRVCVGLCLFGFFG